MENGAPGSSGIAPAEALPAPLILASASPRRAELLRNAGYRFTVRPSAVPEPEEKPPVVPVEIWPTVLALIKAQSVLAQGADGIILAADTIVVLNQHILNKATDRTHAEAILRQLSGSTHRVITGLVLLWHKQVRLSTATSVCRMHPLTDAWLQQYLDSGKWQGRAGAYGIQDVDTTVEVLEGEYTNVIGLPLELLATELRRLRIK